MPCNIVCIVCWCAEVTILKLTKIILAVKNPFNIDEDHAFNYYQTHRIFSFKPNVKCVCVRMRAFGWMLK